MCDIEYVHKIISQFLLKNSIWLFRKFYNIWWINRYETFLTMLNSKFYSNNANAHVFTLKKKYFLNINFDLVLYYASFAPTDCTKLLCSPPNCHSNGFCHFNSPQNIFFRNNYFKNTSLWILIKGLFFSTNINNFKNYNF